MASATHWAEAHVKIARMTLTIKLDGNWSSFQLANSAPPLSVTDSAIAPSARMAGCTASAAAVCESSDAGPHPDLPSGPSAPSPCSSHRGVVRHAQTKESSDASKLSSQPLCGSEMSTLSSEDHCSRDPVQVQSTGCPGQSRHGGLQENGRGPLCERPRGRRRARLPFTSAGSLLGHRPRKNSKSHTDVPHSRQPLVKGERLVRYEVNTVMS